MSERKTARAVDIRDGVCAIRVQEEREAVSRRTRDQRESNQLAAEQVPTVVIYNYVTDR